MSVTLPRVKVEEELLSLPEVAKVLGVSHVQVWRYVRADRLSVVQVGHGVKKTFGVRPEAIAALSATRKPSGRPPKR